MNDILPNLPLYHIFIIILIISSNFLAETFPCRFQSLLASNMYVKHIIGYLTMVFFVSLSIESMSEDFKQLFTKSLYLYFGFLMLGKTNQHFFIVALILLGLLYIINLKKTQIDKKQITLINEQNNKKNNNKNIEQELMESNITLQMINKYSPIIRNITIGVILLGFFVYMGEKKIEYKKNFDYMTFLLGKTSCKGLSPDVSIDQALRNVF